MPEKYLCIAFKEYILGRLTNVTVNITRQEDEFVYFPGTNVNKEVGT